MKATRSNLPHLIAAAGGALLVISLFLSWFSVGDLDASAWKTFSFVDIVLLVIGLGAAVVGGAFAMGAALPVAWLRPHLLKWDGVVAVTIVLTYIFENDNNAFGAFIGLLAALAILAGGILSDRPDLAARVADAAGVDDGGSRPAARPPAGLGSPSSTATPAGPGGGSPGVGSSPLGSSPAGGAPVAAPGAGAASAGPGGAGSATAAGAGAAPGGEGGGPPAGWYPDPQGQARLRYWDGAAWTDQTSS